MLNLWVWICLIYEEILIPKYKFKKRLIYCYDDKDKEIAEKSRGKYNLDIGTTQ